MNTGDEFRRAFETTSDHEVMLDAAGVVTAASDGYLASTGLTRAEVVGRRVEQLPPYRESPILARALGETLEGLRRLPLPHSAALGGAPPCKSGLVFTRALTTPVLDEDRKVSHFLLRLLAEPGQPPVESASERRLRKLIEFNADATLLVDREGRRTFVSAGIERLSGYTPKEYLARPPGFDLHPEDAERVLDGIREVASRPGMVSRFRCRRLHRDGFYRTVDMTLVNHLEDADVCAIVVNVRDVTERAALETELERSHERLRIALSAAGVLCWDRDLSAGTRWFSSDVGEYFRLGPGSYEERMLTTTVHPEDRARVSRALTESMSSGKELQLEFRGPDAGADTRSYATRGAVVTDPTGASRRFVGITWDVTETRRLRDLERKMLESQKLESLGVLAGGIAHDFNNLLTTILGNASLLALNYRTDPRAASFVQPIEDAATRAAELCRQLLAYAGKGTVAPRRTDVNALVLETTRLLRVSMGKQAELVFELGDSLPPILADVTQVRQVLMNLVINASDALGDAAGRVTLRTGAGAVTRAELTGAFLAPELGEGVYVRVSVADTGVGIAAEELGRIFDPFFSTKGLGRGLGLAAVRGIVGAHRGALRVESAPGRGTTFELLLPVAPDEPVDNALARSSSHPAPFTGTLLVVDDEEPVRRATTRLVGSLGFSVLTAGNGEEALTIYREHPEIVAVLMDVTMPRMGGREAMHELRRVDPAAKVLLMSGFAKADPSSEAPPGPPVPFLQKPFTLEQLETELRALLAS